VAQSISKLSNFVRRLSFLAGKVQGVRFRQKGEESDVPRGRVRKRQDDPVNLPVELVPFDFLLMLSEPFLPTGESMPSDALFHFRLQNSTADLEEENSEFDQSDVRFGDGRRRLDQSDVGFGDGRRRLRFGAQRG